MFRVLSDLVQRLSPRDALLGLFAFALVAVVWLVLARAPRDLEAQQDQPSNAEIFQEVIRVQEQVRALDGRVVRLEATIDRGR